MAQFYGEPLSGDPFTDRRRTGVGGSDAAAILGVSPWASALSVWAAKRGAREDFEPTERMVWGSRLERAVIDGYAEDTGRPVRKGTFRRHPDYPFVIGHPDALAGDRILEVKTTAYLGDQWGPDGSDIIPAVYFCQVQHYMLLTSIPLTDVAALVGGREMHVYTVPADPGFQDALLDAEVTFWQKVKDGTPPEPDGSETAAQTLREMFPVAFPEEIVATPEIASAGDEYMVRKAERDAAQRAMEQAKQRMEVYMGSKERLVGPGWTARWSNRAGSPSWREVAARFRDLLIPHYTDDALDALQEAQRGEDTRAFSLTPKRQED